MAKRKSSSNRLGCRQLLIGALLLICAAIFGIFNPSHPRTNTTTSNSSSARSAAVLPTSAPAEATIPPTREAQALSVVSSDTPTATTTARPTRAAPTAPPTPEPVTYYVNSAQHVNARASASTSARIVDTLVPGTAVEILEQVEGDSVNGNTRWYRIEIDGEAAYVHSSLLSRNRPVVQPTPRPVSSGNTSNQSEVVPPTQAPLQSTVAPPPPQPTQLPAPQQGPVSPFGCNGIDDLNCSDFRAIGQSANAHLAQCGDEDDLDHDGDGHACEQ